VLTAVSVVDNTRQCKADEHTFCRNLLLSYEGHTLKQLGCVPQDQQLLEMTAHSGNGNLQQHIHTTQGGCVQSRQTCWMDVTKMELLLATSAIKHRSAPRKLYAHKTTFMPVSIHFLNLSSQHVHGKLLRVSTSYKHAQICTSDTPIIQVTLYNVHWSCRTGLDRPAGRQTAMLQEARPAHTCSCRPGSSSDSTDSPGAAIPLLHNT